MTFNEQLIYLRKQNGLSQEQLGAAVGVTRQTVSKWELGDTTPEMDKLIQLSDLFGITLDRLTGHEETGSFIQNSAGNNLMMYTGRYEYKSKRTFCGLPLVHINIGHGLYKAKGIIAIGNISKGVVSVGMISMGLLSLGTLSFGILSLGALSLGILLSFGAVSLGTIAFGGLSIGIFAIGGCAIGIYSIGGCAIAARIAAGGFANAPISIGNNPKGFFVFNIHEPIASNAIRDAILKEFPNTWKVIVELFNSLA